MSSGARNTEILEYIINELTYQESIEVENILSTINDNVKHIHAMIESGTESLLIYTQDTLSLGNKLDFEYIIGNVRLTMIPKVKSDYPEVKLIIKPADIKQVIDVKGTGYDNCLTIEEWSDFYNIIGDIIVNHKDILRKLGEAKIKKPRRAKKNLSSVFSGLFKKKKKSHLDNDYEDYYEDADDEYYDDIDDDY